MKNWAHILLPLFIGGLIYLFFHQPNLVVHQYIKTPNYYDLFRQNVVFRLFINHVPDILWAYSLSYFLFLSLPITNRWGKLAVVIGMVSLSESIQLFLPAIFTFDLYDLTLMVLAALFTFYLSSYDAK